MHQIAPANQPAQVLGDILFTQKPAVANANQAAAPALTMRHALAVLQASTFTPVTLFAGPTVEMGTSQHLGILFRLVPHVIPHV